MEKQILTIEESNKLIAQFMGVDIVYGGFIFKQQFIPEIKGNTRYGFEYAPLKFQNSWDWLMPVVAKISDTQYAGNILSDIQEALIVADIEKAYQAVVDFIQWYSEVTK